MLHLLKRMQKIIQTKHRVCLRCPSTIPSVSPNICADAVASEKETLPSPRCRAAGLQAGILVLGVCSCFESCAVPMLLFDTNPHCGRRPKPVGAQHAAPFGRRTRSNDRAQFGSLDGFSPARFLIFFQHSNRALRVVSRGISLRYRGW